MEDTLHTGEQLTPDELSEITGGNAVMDCVSSLAGFLVSELGISDKWKQKASDTLGRDTGKQDT